MTQWPHYPKLIRYFLTYVEPLPSAEAKINGVYIGYKGPLL